jgi:hypothetical protein
MIDWQPDNLTFLLDNKVVRTANKVDTSGIAHYPICHPPFKYGIFVRILPSEWRGFSSLWPAGISMSSPGTID